MSNPIGRPHGCTPEILEKARKYVDKPFFESYQKEVVVKDQIQVITLERPNWVSVAGLACEIDVWRKTVYNWADKNHASFNEDFLHIFEALQRKQEILLEYHALTKGYDGGFAKFLACNLTKYREKREDTVTGEISIKLPDAKLTDV